MTGEVPDADAARQDRSARRRPRGRWPTALIALVGEPVGVVHAGWAGSRRGDRTQQSTRLALDRGAVEARAVLDRASIRYEFGASDPKRLAGRFGPHVRVSPTGARLLIFLRGRDELARGVVRSTVDVCTAGAAHHASTRWHHRPPSSWCAT
jgi:hypothetical protein